jgi:hypothetical protein
LVAFVTGRTPAALVVLLALAARPAFAGVLFEVPWGSSEGRIGYYNGTTKGFNQPYAEGPGGIAAGPDDEIWISDQFNDRILRFRRDGRPAGTVTTIADVGLVRPRCLWLLGTRHLAVLSHDTVLWLDRKHDVLHRISTYGDPAEKLRQVELLTGSGDDGLYVGDFGRSALVHFDASGAFAGKQAWGLAGAALDPSGAVYTLEYREHAGARGEHHLVSTPPGGKPREHFPVLLPEGRDPFLVGRDAAGNTIVRFVKGTKEKRFVLVRYGPTGKGAIIGDAHVSVTTQQFALDEHGRVLGLSFDADRAPRGAVEVREFR